MNIRSKAEKVILQLTCLIVVVGVITSFVHEQLFLSKLVLEDGPVEWLTVVGLLSCAGLALARLVSGKKTGRNATYLAGLGIATAVFLFGAGEEISWGQRIFNIQSPEFFVQNNAQQETNLHNLVVGETKINKLIFSKLLGVGGLSFLFVLPSLWSRSPKIRDLAAQWAVPVPRWKQSLLYISLFLLGSLIVSSKRGELIEFAGSWMFFLIFLNPVNATIYQTGKSSDQPESGEADFLSRKTAA